MSPAKELAWAGIDWLRLEGIDWPLLNHCMLAIMDDKYTTAGSERWILAPWSRLIGLGFLFRPNSLAQPP